MASSLFSLFSDPSKETKNSGENDISRGNTAFGQALTVRHERGEIFSEKELLFLRRAKLLKNFHAYRELQTYFFQKLNKVENFEKEKDEIICHAEEAGTLFLTPGHLLAATAYIRLGKFYKDSSEEKMRENAYFDALHHLVMAKALESFSTSQIENAYYGENIASAFKKGYAGGLDFPFNSFDETITQFIKIANLHSEGAKSVCEGAMEMAKKIISDHPIPLLKAKLI